MTHSEDQVVEPKNTLPEVTIDSLSEPLRQAVTRAGWPELMAVQAKAIPYLINHRDIMVQSRTGSGKTGAFVLPLFELINPEQNVCQALVLVPTRELAQQVAKEAIRLSGESSFRTVVVYGGVGYGPQIEGFKKGAHLVVGTPGRILDHLMKRTLSFSDLKVLIFDEADRMLSMGFYPDMKQIQRYLPKRHINGHMFSATFPPFVKRLAKEFLHEPEFLSLSRDFVHVAETEHVYYSVPPMDKDRALVRIIELENPSSAIIFCNTKDHVHYVNVILQRFGYDSDELSADLSQIAREKVMDRVKEGNLRFLVATDVASRGIDIKELSHVFIYEPPDDPEVYIHRAGRTGRAGASGVAITLVAGMEEVTLKDIARTFKINLWEKTLPTDEDVKQIVTERTTARLEAKLRNRDKLQVERMRRFAGLVRELAGTEDGLSLLTMLLDDDYQATLHAMPAGAAPIEYRGESANSPSGKIRVESRGRGAPPRHGPSRGRRQGPRRKR